LPANPFQHVDNVGAAEGEARLQRRREAGERIDDREHPQLATDGELVTTPSAMVRRSNVRR